MADVEGDPALVTADSYDAEARSWHEANRDEDRAVSRRQGYDRLVELFPRGGLVLDLGCGSGLDVADLSARGFRLIGLDVSAAMLAIARALPEVTGRLLLGDMRALPLVDAACDAVWADGSLHHLPKDEAPIAVREAARVLRRGGVLSASVERGDFAGFVEAQQGVAGRRRYSYYEADELAELIAAGFTIVDLVVGGPSSHSAGFVRVNAQTLAR